METATEAPALVRYLHATGLMPYAEMHRWHCRCEHCTGESGFRLRAQTDSSCSGEVITGILHHDPSHHLYYGDLFDQLQAAALAVDAEPGLAAGMHVHVDPARLDQDPDGTLRPAAFWNFIRLEPLLCKLAAGRFTYQRGNNEVVRAQCAGMMRQFIGRGIRNNSGMYDEYVDAVEDLPSPQFFDAIESIYYAHTEHDRHSNLCLTTDHRTWEFRLWNSTRAAWRMELFTRLSVAMVDPTFIDRAYQHDLLRDSTREAADRLAVILHEAGHERCAELVDRQATYTWDAAHHAPSTLTIH